MGLVWSQVTEPDAGALSLSQRYTVGKQWDTKIYIEATITILQGGRGGGGVHQTDAVNSCDREGRNIL